MRIAAIFRGIAAIARQQGPGAAFSWLADRVIRRWFDWHLGISSEAVIDAGQLGLADPDHRGYAPSDYRTFSKVLNAIPVATGYDVFLDLGCGLGRAVVLAAQRPFKRIIGVEISSELVERARRNVAQARRRLRCQAVDVFEGDAAAFLIPDDVTLVYMFNPFCGDPLVSVLKNLGQSLVRKPRAIRLICRVPDRSQFENDIRNTTSLRIDREFSFGHATRYLSLVVKP
jgi:SAM-dependent methyltransferase